VWQHLLSSQCQMRSNAVCFTLTFLWAVKLHISLSFCRREMQPFIKLSFCAPLSRMQSLPCKVAVVNFTNILRAAFTRANPNSAIKLLNLTVLFALLGYACVKAAHKMFVKLTPGYLTMPSKTSFCGSPPLLFLDSLYLFNCKR